MCLAMVGMARCAVPARVVAGGMKYSSATAIRKSCASKELRRCTRRGHRSAMSTTLNAYRWGQRPSRCQTALLTAVVEVNNVLPASAAETFPDGRASRIRNINLKFARRRPDTLMITITSNKGRRARTANRSFLVPAISMQDCSREKVKAAQL
jgi:hypothetical protein